MTYPEIHNCAELIGYIEQIGFLPLLNVGIGNWSAEAVVDEDCQYQPQPDGGFEWSLWEWKGPIIQESGCAYGKFFGGKAGFISKAWWPDFCNWRRFRHPYPVEGSIEEAILFTLKTNGSLITRELRAACGFTGSKMRSKFDGFITKLQMGGYIVTEDFVYPRDRHGCPYGWGWSLLTPAEALLGHDACHTERTPEESYKRLMLHFRKILPFASAKQLENLIG